MGNIIRSPVVHFQEQTPAAPAPPAAVAEVMAQPSGEAPMPAVNEAAVQELLQARLAERLSQLEVERQELREAAAREGYQAGYRKGEEAAAKQSEQLLGRLQRLLSSSAQAQQLAFAEVEQAVLPVVFAVLGKVIGQSVSNAEFVQACVQQALAEVGGREAVIVRLHPADAVLVFPDGRQEWTDEAGRRMTLQPDPSVTGGGCVIETPRGDIDAQLTTQLASLKQLLLEARAV
jgi:flagellar assembly protein FliH